MLRYQMHHGEDKIRYFPFVPRYSRWEKKTIFLMILKMKQNYL